MTFLNLFFITYYVSIFLYVFKKISLGDLKYLLFFICAALPIYFVIQVQVFQISNSAIFVNILKFSKDFLFFYALLIFIAGRKNSFIRKNLNFTIVDKILLCFLLIVFVFTLFPIGEANFISRILYSKNILIILITYFIGRNIEIDYNFYKLITNTLIFVFISATIFSSFEFISETHFHSLIDYSNFKSNFNLLDPQGNYGLNWTFESQDTKPRYGSFFADPLEFSASIIFFLSVILYYLYFDFKKKYIVLIGLIILSLYLSFSRGAIVSCVGVIFISLLINKKFRFLINMFFLTIVISFLTYYFSSFEIKYLIIDTLKFQNSSSLGHLVEWIEGIISIIENPLGIGLAMSGNAFGVDQSVKVGGENQFIIYGVQMGIITLFIYALSIIMIVYRGIKVYLKSNEFYFKHIAFIVICTKFGLILPLLTANAELYLFVSLASWFLAGYTESKFIKLEHTNFQS